MRRRPTYLEGRGLLTHSLRHPQPVSYFITLLGDPPEISGQLERLDGQLYFDYDQDEVLLLHLSEHKKQLQLSLMPEGQIVARGHLEELILESGEA